MKKLPVAADALAYIAVLTVISFVFYFVFKPLLFISVPLLLAIVFFFRNPPRRVPSGENLIVSPADGRVMSVSEIYEDSFINAKAIKVSIFLSLFNVHINRCPIDGKVGYTSYRPGKYLPAFKSHASDINERNTIGLEGCGIKVLVHQITGFVARRIVCWAKTGDTLARGERFGFIKFGSCTEIIVPAGVQIKVNPGDKVKGARTVIGVIA